MREEAIEEITKIIDKYEKELPAMCSVLYSLKGAMLIGCEEVISEHTAKASHELSNLIKMTKAGLN